MGNRSKANKVLDLLQRYEVTELYTNIPEPVWENGSTVRGIAVSARFQTVDRFITFLYDLSTISSDFKIKPVAPALYHGDCSEIRKYASERSLVCCYTAEEGWLYNSVSTEE